MGGAKRTWSNKGDLVREASWSSAEPQNTSVGSSYIYGGIPGEIGGMVDGKALPHEKSLVGESKKGVKVGKLH